MDKKGIIFNLDGDNFYHTRKNMSDKIDEKCLKDYILQYKNTDVTDFMLCVCGMMSSYPSETKTFYGDRYKNGEVGHDNVCRVFHEVWTEKGFDVFKIWIDTLREANINPWLSFRMNDAHCHYDDNKWLLSDWFCEHIDEYARIRHYNSQLGRFGRNRDYGLYEVRKEILDYIEETLERYNPYGIELDYVRELWCFQLGHEQNNCDIMTAFLEDVKKIVKNAEEKWDQKIKIAVRTHSNPIYALELGFDFMEWAKRGLVDLVIPSPRWRTCDNDMPITLWKKMLEPYNIEVAGCIEVLIDAHPGSTLIPDIVRNTVETTLGSANNIFSQGADKLYLFNYFNEKIDEMIVEDRRKITDENDLTVAEGYYKIMTTAGSPEKLLNSNRRNVVTYNDVVPEWRDNCPILPVVVDRDNKPYYIRIVTGEIKEDSKVKLRLGIKEIKDPKLNPASDMQVFVNSVKCELIGEETCGNPALAHGRVYAFSVPKEAVGKLIQLVEILSMHNKIYEIDYADITVNVQ